MLLAALLLTAAPANANQAVLEQLRAYDERVGTIGDWLAHGGAQHCPGVLVPLAGLRVHTLGQYGKRYRSDARALFGLGDYPAILMLTRDGPAAMAGLAVGDAIVSVNGADMKAGQGYAGVERFDDALEAALATPPAELVIERRGARRTVMLTGISGCASRIELVPGKKLNAAADGRIVQLTTAVLEQAVDDDELAFIIAHEMAHNILKHRERLDREGRSTANIRASEVEADILAIRLMHGGGYDPRAAARFWARFGKKTGAGIFSDRTHLRTKDRVRLLTNEAQKLAQ
jgi:hypothetical protein